MSALKLNAAPLVVIELSLAELNVTLLSLCDSALPSLTTLLSEPFHSQVLSFQDYVLPDDSFYGS